MAIIYRLESATEPNPDHNNVNEGAYRIEFEGCLIGSFLTGSDQDDDTHPLAANDPLLKQIWDYDMYGKYYFCFNTLQSLRAWFMLDKDREQKVNCSGIARIGVYHVPDEYYHKGQFQAIALGSEMKIIEAWDISHQP